MLHCAYDPFERHVGPVAVQLEVTQDESGERQKPPDKFQDPYWTSKQSAFGSWGGAGLLTNITCGWSPFTAPSVTGVTVSGEPQAFDPHLNSVCQLE